jgi:hypothetical protein
MWTIDWIYSEEEWLGRMGKPINFSLFEGFAYRRIKRRKK